MSTQVLNGLNLSGQKITNLADPTSAADAVTKSYVDSFVRGMSWKDSVLVASTADVSVASAPASIDTVALPANARVLLKNQTTASENGIYVYTATGSPLTRAADLPNGADARGVAVTVRGGSANDDTVWHVTSDPAVVGTDAITWSPLGGGGGTTYTAGAGLAESPAGTFNVGAGAGITVNADDVALASSSAGAGLTYNTGVLAVGAGTGITVNADDVQIDTGTVVRKFATNVGDGTATQIDVTHNLNTRDVTVEVFINSGGYETVLADVSRPTVNAVRLNFATAPTSAQYRVVVHG